MSIDILHEKIRKTKNPLIMDFSIRPELMPGHLMEQEGSFDKAYPRFCNELMDGLAGLIPGVRFSFDTFALLGEDGLSVLRKLLAKAGQLGFYVLLDGPQVLSPWAADRAAELLKNDTYLFRYMTPSAVWEYENMLKSILEGIYNE